MTLAVLFGVPFRVFVVGCLLLIGAGLVRPDSSPMPGAAITSVGRIGVAELDYDIGPHTITLSDANSSWGFRATSDPTRVFDSLDYSCPNRRMR